MKYDLRVNGFFWRQIDGKNIDEALNNAGLDIDWTTSQTGSVLSGGYLDYDGADLIGIAKSGGMPDELTSYILSDNYDHGSADWGFAE